MSSVIVDQDQINMASVMNLGSNADGWNAAAAGVYTLFDGDSMKVITITRDGNQLKLLLLQLTLHISYCSS